MKLNNLLCPLYIVARDSCLGLLLLAGGAYILYSLAGLERETETSIFIVIPGALSLWAILTGGFIAICQPLRLWYFFFPKS